MSWLDRIVSYGSYLVQGHIPTEPEVATRERHIETAREEFTRSQAHALGYALGRIEGRAEVGRPSGLGDFVGDYHGDLQFQAGARALPHILGHYPSARLIRAGYTPVASMESGALFTAGPNPECGRTMSCAPSTP